MQKPANFEEIKDTIQLKEFLAKHNIQSGTKKSTTPGLVSQGASDYQGMKQKLGSKAVNPKKLLSDRYENRSSRRT